MLSLPPSVKVFVATEPVDGRKGFDSLIALAQSTLGENPLSGHLFVFRTRRGNLVRTLFWDRNGFCLMSKRLERGCFQFPWTVPEGAQRIEVEAAELALMLEGIELAGARRTPRWTPETSTPTASIR